MARIRSIHPGLFTDEAFVQLSADAQIFFLGLWTEADDQGVFEWKPLTLRMRLRPTKDGAVDPLLAEIVAVDGIRQFEIAGRQYGAIRNFRKYQRPKSPNAVHPITDHIRNYVALSAAISEIEGDEAEPIPPKGEIAPQMEDGGDKMEDGGDIEDTSGAALPQPPALPPPFIEIPTNRFETRGEQYPVYELMIEEFQGLYRAVDVRAELRKMRGWSLSNPRKCKTKRGMKAFINGWLAREQDKPARETQTGGRNGGQIRKSAHDSFIEGAFLAVGNDHGMAGPGSSDPEQTGPALLASGLQRRAG